MCVFDHLDVSHVSMMYTVNSASLDPKTSFWLLLSFFPFIIFFIQYMSHVYLLVFKFLTNPSHFPPFPTLCSSPLF